MSDRGIWVRIFQENGYSQKAIHEMDNTSFQNLVNFFLDSGLQPDSAPPPGFDETPTSSLSSSGSSPQQQYQYRFNFSDDINPPNSASHPPNIPYRKNSSSIREDQNMEYVRALNEMEIQDSITQRRKEEEENRIREMEMRRQEEQRKKQEEHEKVLEKARSLPDEPSEIKSDDQSKSQIGKVVAVAVVLPGGRRVQRRFEATQMGDDVYSWCAANDEMFEEKLVPLKFRLVQTLGEELEEKKTLEEQKMLRRILLNVVLLD